jgi:N-acetylmuramoyl-L-alanine amidase
MLTISNHTLSGATPQGHAVQHSATPNQRGDIVPRFLIFHYTACSAQAAKNAFMRQAGASSVSAHLLVDSNGEVTQFVPFNRRAWHAGKSEWGEYKDLNSHSIGIEVVNYGYLLKTAAGTFQTAEGKQTIPAAQVVEARHRLPRLSYNYWHAYTPEQIDTCEALAELLASEYTLQDVLGHDDIAPTRKSDPGPSFPMSRIRSLAIGRDSDTAVEDIVYVAVDKLNIRRGAGPAFEKAGPPLIRNLRLNVLTRDPGGWFQVATFQAPPLTGWVFGAYTSSRLT